MNRISYASQLADAAWTLYNHQLNIWNTALSFESLQEEGLVHCYDEWMSMKTAFYYKDIAPHLIIHWLKNQTHRFRVSYLCHTLVSGFGRNMSSLFHVTSVPRDIQNIIISYCNLTFIKLYPYSDSKQYELISFDINLRIDNLMKILQNVTKKEPIRIWCRYNTVKFIYSVPEPYVHKNANYKTQTHTRPSRRWVEVPAHMASKMTIKSIDDGLQYGEILEIGVDRLRRVYYDVHIWKEHWSFLRNRDIKQVNNRLTWICALEIGDIIDVKCEDGSWMQAYIEGRDYDQFYVHSVDNDSFEAVRSIGSDLDRLWPRNIATNVCSTTQCPNQYIVCPWITVFAGDLYPHIWFD